MVSVAAGLGAGSAAAHAFELPLWARGRADTEVGRSEGTIRKCSEGNE